MEKRTHLGITFLCFSVAIIWSGAVQAQELPYECDDNFDECGTPEQSGGGNAGGGLLINGTDLGDTYQYADDYDNDGIEDPYDNCPFVANSDQANDDGDLHGNVCDNCVIIANDAQENIDGDLEGNVCDKDMDGDSIINAEDLCPTNPDPQQVDTDKDGMGDACDPDMDNDGVANLNDNCPLVYNPEQESDTSKFGVACNADDDSDTIRNINDNCPQVSNENQLDTDVDGIGDKCDTDMDNDLVNNNIDNCPLIANPDQADIDRDLLGDACDDKYCYVVMGDKDNCLDPTDVFTIYSPALPTIEDEEDIMTGDKVRLRLFANRYNKPLRYSWTIVDAPSGSSAHINNPSGAASVSTPFEYHYQKDTSVSFTPDMPGTYTIKVSAELAITDEVTNEKGARSEAISIIEVGGNPLENGNCSVSNVGSKNSNLASGLFIFALLSLGMSVLIRRKHS